MQMNSFNREKTLTLFLYLTIPVLLSFLFIIYPLIRMFIYSLTNWNGISLKSTFVGLENYSKIFLDRPEIWLSLKNNGIYFLGHLFFIPLEILIAFYLVRQVRGNRFFKTMVLIPYIINGVAISYIFNFFFSPNNGTMDLFMSFIFDSSTSQVHWLSDPGIVNFTLASVSLWRHSGFHIVLFLAGIISIPKEQFEAARIDGAGESQIFFRIVIPNIIIILEIVLFLNVRGALQVFDIPFVMTGGGPGYASATFTILTIQNAFKYNSFGLACAMAVILFVMIVLISQIQNLIIKAGKLL